MAPVKPCFSAPLKKGNIFKTHSSKTNLWLGTIGGNKSHTRYTYWSMSSWFKLTVLAGHSFLPNFSLEEFLIKV